MRSILTTLALPALLLAAAQSYAEDARLSPLRGLELVGQAQMQVMLWKVYDARLYSPSGTWQGTPPYALALTYLRKLKGERIAERSVREIREQGFTDELTLARWYELLVKVIPDVGTNDEIIGIADEAGATQFWLNGAPIGKIAEPAFTERFFAIWLGERTSVPDMRQALLGDRS
jgi:hypothetical protein